MELNEAMSILLADTKGLTDRNHPVLKELYETACTLVLGDVERIVFRKHASLQPPPARHMRAFNMKGQLHWTSILSHEGETTPVPPDAQVWYLDTTVWQHKDGKPVKRLNPPEPAPNDAKGWSEFTMEGGRPPTNPPQDYATGYREAMEVAAKELGEALPHFAQAPEVDLLSNLMFSFYKRSKSDSPVGEGLKALLEELWAQCWRGLPVRHVFKSDLIHRVDQALGIGNRGDTSRAVPIEDHETALRRDGAVQGLLLAKRIVGRDTRIAGPVKDALMDAIAKEMQMMEQGGIELHGTD